METKRELPAFVADVMVGRLARWLRTAGFDTTRVDEADVAGSLARAAAEGRHLVTRRTGISYGGPGSLLITSDHWREQFAEVMLRFGLGRDDLLIMVRCNCCNQVLEAVPRETVQAEVPPFVYQTHEHFMRCPGCRRAYWTGTHLERIRREFDDIFIVYLFACSRCGARVQGREARYRGRIELASVGGPLELTAEDLARDQTEDLERLLEQISGMSEAELEEGVAVAWDLALCRRCHGQLLSLVKGFLGDRQDEDDRAPGLPS